MDRPEHWRDQHASRVAEDAGLGADHIDTVRAGFVRRTAEEEGDTGVVSLHLLSAPRPGCPLHVEICDESSPDSWNPLDELRFRGRRYPVGTQIGSLYVMMLPTDTAMDKLATQWERPTIRFYRNYGEGGYKQKAMLRFEWIEDAQVLEGRPIRPHKIF